MEGGRWKVDPAPDSELDVGRSAQPGVASERAAASLQPHVRNLFSIYSGVGMIQLRVRVLRRLTVYNNLQQDRPRDIP